MLIRFELMVANFFFYFYNEKTHEPEVKLPGLGFSYFKWEI